MRCHFHGATPWFTPQERKSRILSPRHVRSLRSGPYRLVEANGAFAGRLSRRPIGIKRSSSPYLCVSTIVIWRLIARLRSSPMLALRGCPCVGITKSPLPLAARSLGFDERPRGSVGRSAFCCVVIGFCDAGLRRLCSFLASRLWPAPWPNHWPVGFDRALSAKE